MVFSNKFSSNSLRDEDLVCILVDASFTGGFTKMAVKASHGEWLHLIETTASLKGLRHVEQMALIMMMIGDSLQ